MATSGLYRLDSEGGLAIVPATPDAAGVLAGCSSEVGDGEDREPVLPPNLKEKYRVLRRQQKKPSRNYILKKLKPFFIVSKKLESPSNDALRLFSLGGPLQTAQLEVIF